MTFQPTSAQSGAASVAPDWWKQLVNGRNPYGSYGSSGEQVFRAMDATAGGGDNGYNGDNSANIPFENSNGQPLINGVPYVQLGTYANVKDPSKAKWDDTLGVITPYSNINPVADGGNTLIGGLIMAAMGGAAMSGMGALEGAGSGSFEGGGFGGAVGDGGGGLGDAVSSGGLLNPTDGVGVGGTTANAAAGMGPGLLQNAGSWALAHPLDAARAGLGAYSLGQAVFGNHGGTPQANTSSNGANKGGAGAPANIGQFNTAPPQFTPNQYTIADLLQSKQRGY